MKKLLLVLALAAFAPLGYADDKGKDDAKEHVKKEHEKDHVKKDKDHEKDHVKKEDDDLNDAEAIAKAIEEILANYGKVPAKETAKAVKEFKKEIREAVREGDITREEGANALNELEIALSNGGNPVSPS
jgi:triphosphoribosyl-dephospho-CoA synthetase